MLSYVRRLMRAGKDRGASAVEYGLMVAAIAAVIVGIVFGLGTVVQSVFNDTCNGISNANNASANPDKTATNCP